ncbi:MAG: S8 family serine peptidase [Anaerolineae bacterium]|nr:S8 family serine peptidase [Anaerolineae bacterium]
MTVPQPISPRSGHRYLNTPWATTSDLYSPPGSLIVKLALGEAPERIPALLDVRRKVVPAAVATSVGSVDRLLHHFSDDVKVMRLYSAAANRNTPGQRHQHFDDVEHALGMSRTFRLEASKDASVDDLVSALRQLAVVEQAYPNYLTTLPFESGDGADSGQFSEQNLDAAWRSREMVKLKAALAFEAGDPSIIVGVADTGVKQTHPEIEKRLRVGIDTVQLSTTSMSAGVQLLGDFRRMDTDPEDMVGHGTACAGIIGALGTHGPPGLAGDCRIFPARVLGAAVFPGKDVPVGIGAIADIDVGMKMCIDLGVKVINMSFGTPESLLDPNDPLPHEDVVRYGLARGCVMIAASGNSGRIERFSPACLSGVIAVGAVDEKRHPTAFSTRGDHVALCAPGVEIFSAGLNGYQRVTGTSFAAPFVTATAALLVSHAARHAYPLDSPTIRRVLIRSAQRWHSAEAKGMGHGAGIVDAYAALQALDEEIARNRAMEDSEDDDDRAHTQRARRDV